MKKIILLLVVAACMGLQTKAQEKAFIKGKVIISASASLGVYATKINSEWDYLSIHEAHDTNSGAASGVYALNLEYAVNNWLGIGGRFGYSKYYAETDKATGTKPYVNGWDGDLTLGLHLIKTVHFDMPVQFTFGYSHIKYLALDTRNGIVAGGGLNYGIALVPRIYFGKHFGMFFNVGYMGYNYPNLTLSDNTNVYNIINYKFKLKADGANVGLGFMFKFH